MNSDSLELLQQTSIYPEIRKTQQFLMPAYLSDKPSEKSQYEIYPAEHLGDGKIFSGFSALADYIIDHKNVVIDGFGGVFWDRIQLGLQQCFDEKQLSVNWISASDFLKNSREVDKLVAPFLGEENAVWGTKAKLELVDLFEPAITKQTPENDSPINIMIGTGAALAGWDAPLIYIDRLRKFLKSEPSISIKSIRAQGYKLIEV